MREQMVKRIPGYSGRYPWWGWVHPKPDLRRDHLEAYLAGLLRRWRSWMQSPDARTSPS